jgi:hypothetical protein
MIFAGLCALFFGRSWCLAGREDFFAVSVLSGAGLVLSATFKKTPRRIGTILSWAILLACAWQAGSGELCFESALSMGIGVVASIGALYLCLEGEHKIIPDSVLTFLALVFLLAGALGRGRGPDQAWTAQVVTKATECFGAWLLSQGPLRWVGIMAALTSGVLLRLCAVDTRPSRFCRATTADGKPINWNF